MIVVTAPQPYTPTIGHRTVFVGGSIEMGAAELWQDKLATSLSKFDDNVVLLNPRRDDWDSSWLQDPTYGTNFHTQVSWEMDSQEDSDFLIYYFDPATKSPITLLELGTYGVSNAENTIVCCPPDFYRYGNVAMLCARYNITLVESFPRLVREVINRLLESGAVWQ